MSVLIALALIPCPSVQTDRHDSGNLAVGIDRNGSEDCLEKCDFCQARCEVMPVRNTGDIRMDAGVIGAAQRPRVGEHQVKEDASREPTREPNPQIRMQKKL